MQLQGSRADPAQLERLQSMLSEKNGEIQNLMMKLQRLEKVEVSASSTLLITLHFKLLYTILMFIHLIYTVPTGPWNP